MPSSISSSEIAHRGIRRLLFAWLGLLLAGEAFVRFGLPLVNETQRRFNKELRAAEVLRASPGEETTSLLFVGNSLTFSDIDLKVLESRTQGRYIIKRWAVDGTSFLDWYYGLQRIFSSGSRPSVVLIGARAGNLSDTRFRGYFFAHYILAWADVVSFLSEVKPTLTQASNLLIARCSALMGSREQIYKRAVGSAIPGFEALAVLLTRSRAGASLPSAALVSSPALRLQGVDALCRRHGARLVIWVPATPHQDSQAEVLNLHGSDRDLPDVLHPLRDGELTRSDYVDDLHMNSSGAAKFTEALSGQLLAWLHRERLNSRSGAVPHSKPDASAAQR